MLNESMLTPPKESWWEALLKTGSSRGRTFFWSVRFRTNALQRVAIERISRERFNRNTRFVYCSTEINQKKLIVIPSYGDCSSGDLKPTPETVRDITATSERQSALDTLAPSVQRSESNVGRELTGSLRRFSSDEVKLLGSLDEYHPVLLDGSVRSSAAETDPTRAIFVVGIGAVALLIWNLRVIFLPLSSSIYQNLPKTASGIATSRENLAAEIDADLKNSTRIDDDSTEVYVGQKWAVRFDPRRYSINVFSAVERMMVDRVLPSRNGLDLHLRDGSIIVWNSKKPEDLARAITQAN